ncbi:MAG TPA: serine/threonine-protein kinase [Kofleriaceae bacterium]|nr:serine/threonine-protein kinase [Kofleriaceae bacterium]
MQRSRTNPAAPSWTLRGPGVSTLRAAAGDAREVPPPDATLFAAGSVPCPGMQATIPMAPGTLIGNYRVIEPLATGGMGEVHLAVHVHLGRRAAIKLLHGRLVGDAEAAARFFAEAIAIARVQHPGIVALYDYGPYEGGAYLAMEYLEGETLRQRLDRTGRLAPGHAAWIGVQLAHTLAAAHAAGIIHRDLKPENIFLVRDPSGGQRDIVKLLDFGVAKLGREPTASFETQRGDLLGTPFYMAPEQCMHAGAVDARSDVYALGCVLYQLVTGEVPFMGTLMQILVAHQTAPVPHARALEPELPPALDALVARMMDKAPERRPQSMAEVSRALRAIPPCAGQARRGRGWLGLWSR